MAEIDERELMERIRKGDREACDECIRQHAAGVYRVALRLVRNSAEAEDVMQETFLNAFKGIHRFDGRASLRTWLFRIAHNAALMRLRRPAPEFVPVEDMNDISESGTPVPRQLFDWRAVPEREFATAELRSETKDASTSLATEMSATLEGSAVPACRIWRKVLGTRIRNGDRRRDRDRSLAQSMRHRWRPELDADPRLRAVVITQS